MNAGWLLTIHENALLPEVDVSAANEDVDAHVLDPMRDGHDWRHQEWRDVVSDSYDCVCVGHHFARRRNAILSALSLATNMQHAGERSFFFLGLSNFATIKRLRPEDAVDIQLEAWCHILLFAAQYDQLNLGSNASLEEVARQIQSYVDAHSDVSCVSRKKAKHDSSRMTAADVIVLASRRRVSAGSAGAGRRSWSLARIGKAERHQSNPTGPYQAAPAECEDAAGEHAKDGMKGCDKGKRNKGGRCAVVAPPTLRRVTERLVLGKPATLTTKLRPPVCSRRRSRARHSFRFSKHS